MDELTETSNLLSYVERARNRLAIALFSVCLAVMAVWLLVDQPSKTYERERAELSKARNYWLQVERRRIGLAENAHAFFVDALQDLLLSVCVPSRELKRLEDNYTIEVGGNAHRGRPLKYADSDLGAPSCRSGEVPWTLVRADISQAAEHLAKLSPTTGVPATETIEKALTDHLSRTAHELITSIHTKRELLANVQGWWLWRTQRFWLSEGKLGPGYAIYDYGSSRIPASSSRLSDRVVVIENPGIEESIINRDRLGAVKNLGEAKPIIDSARSHLEQLWNTRWSMQPAQVQVGGVTVGLAQALELLVPVMSILSVLFVIFFSEAEARVGSRKAGRFPNASKTRLWFPRMGCPLDPLTLPMPVSLEGWFARFGWFAFLAAPVVLAFFSMWTGMIAEHFLEREAPFGNNRFSNWVTSILFWVIWAGMLRVTGKESAPPRWLFSIVAVVTVVVAVWFLGGAVIGELKELVVFPEAIYQCGDCFQHQMTAFTYPAYWIPVGIWLILLMQRRRVSWYGVVMATLLTVAMMPNLGNALLRLWATTLP